MRLEMKTFNPEEYLNPKNSDEQNRQIIESLLKSEDWAEYNKIPTENKRPLHLYAIGSNQSSFVAKEVRLVKTAIYNPKEKEVYAIFSDKYGSYHCEILGVC